MFIIYATLVESDVQILWSQDTHFHISEILTTDKDW
jgi:hypothetical protein